ncbi:MAG: hypothetical protein HRT94_05375 [Alphaproteobacteria bacterium]|nr:hypothetical protein [Alphaproteobacteria bacterium]
MKKAPITCSIVLATVFLDGALHEASAGLRRCFDDTHNTTTDAIHHLQDKNPNLGLSSQLKRQDQNIILCMRDQDGAEQIFMYFPKTGSLCPAVPAELNSCPKLNFLN